MIVPCLMLDKIDSHGSVILILGKNCAVGLVTIKVLLTDKIVFLIVL